MKIQKWIRRTMIRIKMRRLFTKAAPIIVTTFKQIGVYWKCVVSHKDKSTLCFKLKTLPGHRNEQELHCPYTDQDGDKLQFAK